MSIPDWIDDNVTDEAVKKKLKTLPQKRKYVTQAAYFIFAHLAIATVFACCCVSLFNLYFVFVCLLAGHCRRNATSLSQ